MTRSFVYAAAIFALAACSDGPSPTSPSAGQMPSFASSAAGGGATSTQVPFSGVLMSPCSRETIFYRGTMHMVTHTRRDASGGRHSFTMSNLQGVSATAESGRKYRLVGANKRTENASASGAHVVSQVAMFGVVSQGSIDNWFIRITVHVTMNANGEPTAVKSEASEECRG